MADDPTRSPDDPGAMRERLNALEEENVHLRQALAAARRRVGLCDTILESAADYAIFTIDPEGRVTSWNAGAENLLGWREAEALGMDSRVVFLPEDRERGAPEAEMAKAVAEGRDEDERWRLRRDGSRFWSSGLLLPLRGDAAPGFLKILRDASERRRTEKALRASERRLAAALAAARMATWDWDPVRDEVAASDTAAEVFGLLPGETLHSSMQGFGFVHPDDLERHRAIVQAAGSGYGSWHHEFRIVRPRDGQVAWLEERANATRDADTGLVHMTGLVWDITERKQAEEALRESEERFRQFAENSADVLWIIAAATLRLEYLSPSFERLWGESRAAVMADLGRWAELVHPEDRERAIQAREHLLRGETLAIEYRIICPADGAVRWIRDTGFPIRGAPDAGHPEGIVQRVAGIAQDVTAEKEAAERQQRLARELNHRVKNVLAVVQAIASQTILASRSLDEFAEAFEGRLGALAQAHGLLTTTGWQGADLKALVEETLEPYRDSEAAAATADGPPIALPPRRAVALALVLHELATNAAKHGALSVPGGKVGVRWEVREEDGARRVRLVWQETGGPEVRPPARKGFGTGLIEQALKLDLEGMGGLRFEPQGLVCELSFPLG